MMNHSLKSRYKVQPGTVITGKWHNNHYTILKELGYGANGVVYLVKYGSRHAALKMSDNSMSITSEVNVLKSFAKVQGTSLGPSLLDMDDWQTGGDGSKVSFYVMEYIQGPDLLSFLQQKGKSWMPVVFLQLLNDLAQIHENGWVFGDLKPENLIVTGPPPAVRCIDVGGTTIQGRAIKEFTEFYDRGYWGLGSRKAKPSYDLFACAMIMINTAYPNRFAKQQIGGIAQLKAAVRQRQELLPYEKVILRALEGQYLSAKQMRDDLLQIVTRQDRADRPKTSGGSGGGKGSPQSPLNSRKQQQKQPSAQSHPSSRKAYRKHKKKSRWKEYLIIAAVLGGLYGWYIFMKIL
ncbi:protein kinase domain-containing protein [Neobacillus muris]|uniref:protein kinase domain-containing protein n=1 Tax=Neobacillus muris TaxID=2941334 RepID=UPI00203FFDAD|nr:protein kinase family protein [Neobacillus muris]